jgi:hypothetical protein
MPERYAGRACPAKLSTRATVRSLASASGLGSYRQAVRPIHLALAICVTLLVGCGRAKREKCEVALTKMWGQQAAQDESYKASFMERCQRTPDDVIDCILASSESHQVDPECDAKIKRFREAEK